MSDRRPNPSDPTAERTAEPSTPGASGSHPDREQRRRDDDTVDPISRGPEDDRATPRRYDEDERDPVMPTDDASLGTKL